MDSEQVSITKYKYRGLAFEKRVASFGTFGYIFLPYRLFPEEVIDAWFIPAEPTTLKTGNTYYFGEIPEPAKSLARRTRISFNGVEWRHIIGTPMDHSYLMMWWDYEHYGWGPPSVCEDAHKFIDALVRYVKEYGDFNIRCPNCGKLFPEGSGWEPGFGKWTEVCPKCEPEIREIKASREK